MKKIVKPLLVTVLLLSIVLAVAACGPTSDNPQHRIAFIVGDTMYDSYWTRGNEIIPLPAVPSSSYGDLVGWYFDNGVWKERFDPNAYAGSALTKDISVYARFGYSVTYVYGSESRKTNYEPGATIVPSVTPAIDGQIFQYWYENDPSIAYVFAAMPKRSFTLYAKFKGIDLNKVLINQIYGIADKTDASGSNSFVELYNDNSVAVSLDGWSLQASEGGAGWDKLDLSGTIPAHKSFLIVLTKYANTSLSDPPNLRITQWDMEWANVSFQNKALKVALRQSTVAFNVVNPFNTDGNGTKAAGYVDMLAMKGTGKNDAIDAWEGGAGTLPPIGQSKQKALRRVDFKDTDNNAADTEFIDWSSYNVQKYRPRSLADPAWTETADVPAYSQTTGVLPVISISVENGAPIPPKSTTSDEGVYIGATFKLTEGDATYFDGRTGEIKVRGNTTKNQPKDPYRIKFTSKTSLFGSQAFKSWVLLASYFDGSLVRDYAGYTLSEQFESQSFGRTVYHVEVYINGAYKGVYLLTDQIQEQRLGIEIDDAELLDGGAYYAPEFGTDDFAFLVELDGNAYAYDPFDPALDDANAQNGDFYYNAYDANAMLNSFTVSTIGGYGIVAIKYPSMDEHFLNETQFKYIYTYVQYVDYLLRHPLDPNSWTELEKLIDIDSFLDYYLIQEWFMQGDLWGKSVYMYKEVGGKLKMGPIWDMDWSVGGPFSRHLNKANNTTNLASYPWPWEYNLSNITYTGNNAGKGYSWMSSSNWFGKLLRFPSFVSAMQYRWDNLIQDIFTAHLTTISNYYTHISAAGLRNQDLWFTTMAGGSWTQASAVGKDILFQEQYAYVIGYLTQRIMVLNSMIHSPNQFDWTIEAPLSHGGIYDWQDTNAVENWYLYAKDVNDPVKVW
jgi:hypothetical protein